MVAPEFGFVLFFFEIGDFVPIGDGLHLLELGELAFVKGLFVWTGIASSDDSHFLAIGGKGEKEVAVGDGLANRIEARFAIGAVVLGKKPDRERILESFLDFSGFDLIGVKRDV